MGTTMHLRTDGTPFILMPSTRLCCCVNNDYPSGSPHYSHFSIRTYKASTRTSLQKPPFSTCPSSSNNPFMSVLNPSRERHTHKTQMHPALGSLDTLRRSGDYVNNNMYSTTGLARNGKSLHFSYPTMDFWYVNGNCSRRSH